MGRRAKRGVKDQKEEEVKEEEVPSEEKEDTTAQPTAQPTATEKLDDNIVPLAFAPSIVYQNNNNNNNSVNNTKNRGITIADDVNDEVSEEKKKFNYYRSAKAAALQYKAFYLCRTYSTFYLIAVVLTAIIQIGVALFGIFSWRHYSPWNFMIDRILTSSEHITAVYMLIFGIIMLYLILRAHYIATNAIKREVFDPSLWKEYYIAGIVCAVASSCSLAGQMYVGIVITLEVNQVVSQDTNIFYMAVAAIIFIVSLGYGISLASRVWKYLKTRCCMY